MCAVELHIKDGRLEKVEEDKDSPDAKMLRRIVRGCPRSRRVADFLYHPDRLSFPLKRVGERGEGRWQKISWKQGLDEVAEKLSEIRNKYGAEAVATSSGTGRTDDEYRIRFFNLFGSPNNIGQGNICFGPGNMMLSAMFGWPDARSLPGRMTKCTMFFGTNPEQAMRRHWVRTLDFKKAGGKLIVVDPRRTPGAERADLWLQLRPGTDCALYLGMINVIINEGLYDKEFVDKWCYGFDKLVERVNEYPVEKVADITWVPADKIREAARMYATNKPGVISRCMGVEHLRTSIEAYHASGILTAITGNLDIRGGEAFGRTHPQLSRQVDINLNEKLPLEQRQKAIGADRFRLQSLPGYERVGQYAHMMLCRGHNVFAHAPSVYRAMITGKPYPVRAMITLSSNPMVTQPNVKLVYKAIKSLDLYVVDDYWLTPSAELADYVFPAASWLERPTIWNGYDSGDFVSGCEAAMPAQVEGQYDRKTDYEFWRGLGIRLGQEEYWPWQTLEEAFDHRFEPMGLTFKQFVREVRYTRATREDQKYEKTGFGTSTKKAELYSTVLEELGYDPLPRYYEAFDSPIGNPELAKEYPLILITGKRHQPYYHSEHRQIDSLRKQHPYPLVEIHPETASRLGIADSDWVWIETPRGRVKQRCEYTDGIDPRVVSAEHGWWFPELPGEEPWLHGVWESNINVVTDDEPDHCNPINGGWPLRTLLCKVYRAKTY
jgi:anaerobic selenocysteine-containing dehydrogenase